MEIVQFKRQEQEQMQITSPLLRSVSFGAHKESSMTVRSLSSGTRSEEPAEHAEICSCRCDKRNQYWNYSMEVHYIPKDHVAVDLCSLSE